MTSIEGWRDEALLSRLIADNRPLLPKVGGWIALAVAGLTGMLLLVSLAERLRYARGDYGDAIELLVLGGPVVLLFVALAFWGIHRSRTGEPAFVHALRARRDAVVWIHEMNIHQGSPSSGSRYVRLGMADGGLVDFAVARNDVAAVLDQLGWLCREATFGYTPALAERFARDARSLRR